MGYHINDIKRGEFGKASKIVEEVHELLDSLEQKNRIMALQELSDLYGAVRGYLEKEFPGFTMEDLKIMADATKRAFEDGTRD